MVKLFSIKEEYCRKIYSEEKLVEFRRQNVNINHNEICLIYTTAPIKKITGYFIVKEKIRTSINKLWELTKELAGISFEEFNKYFKGCLEGTAIIFKKVKEFINPISLDELRTKIKNFRPPQSFYNIDDLISKIQLFSEFDELVMNQ